MQVWIVILVDHTDNLDDSVEIHGVYDNAKDATIKWQESVAKWKKIAWGPHKVVIPDKCWTGDGLCIQVVESELALH